MSVSDSRTPVRQLLRQLRGGVVVEVGSAVIPRAHWLRVLDEEYLSGFVRDGGAAVKFAVASDEGRSQLQTELRSLAEERGYVFTAVSAEACRVHMPQDIFFTLAGQLDWRALARRVNLRLLGEEGMETGGVDPEAERDVLGAVARQNGIETRSVMLRWRPALERGVTKNGSLTRAFRIAMTHLCIEERGGPVYQGQPILDWLTGANRRIGPLRPFQIHTAINRVTARHLIESLFSWVRLAGYPGTVILLDNARVTVPRNPRDEKRYYTRLATTDHYELLREFIDDVDLLSGALLVVATDSAFVDENSARGWGIYSALRTRVMDDVRDRKLVNPVAGLVRLSADRDRA